MEIVLPASPWANSIRGRAAYTAPKSATIAPPATGVQADREDDRLTDRRPFRVGPEERRRTGGPDVRHPGPRAVVVPGTRPPLGMVAPVDPFHEVTALGVSLRRREPLGRALAPARIRTDDHVAAVVVVQGQLEQEARGGRGPPLAGPVPPVQHADRAGPATVQRTGQVDGAHVLLIGIGEAGPGVHRYPVHIQAIRVGGGDVGRGALQGACGRRDLGAQVGHAIGLLRVPGGTQPPGLPVGGAQPRRERGRSRDRPPSLGSTTRLDRPLVRRVGGERWPGIGDEGLAGRRHRAAVPHEPAVGRVGPADRDAGGRLRHPTPGPLQGPGERAVVGVDADGIHETVDRERSGPQRAGWPRSGGARQGPLRMLITGGRGASRQRAGHRGARGDAAGRGEEGAPAEPVPPHAPPISRTWSRLRSL